MTRKEALSKAIKILSDFDETKEIISLLSDLKEELPIIHWTDKSIRDIIEQFIQDNGRIPTASDFRKKGMPPHPVFKQKYKITLAEWMDINYPQRKPDYEELHRQDIDIFVKEYMFLKPKSAEDYNQRRASYTKCWASIAFYNGVKNWGDLLNKLSLPCYGRQKNSFLKRTKPNLTVVIHTDYTELDKLYRKNMLSQ